MNTQPDTIIPFPHSVGAEKSVLSVLLQYPEKFEDAPDLTAEHFHMPGARVLFAEISDMLRAGKPIELVSLAQHLLDQGLMDRIGGPATLTDLYTYMPSPGNFRQHLDELNRKLACRMTIAAAREMERAAYESPDASEIIEVTSAPISAIHDILTANRPAKSTKAVTMNCMERFERRCRGEETPMGIETSLFEINRRFRGLHQKQTVVISAYPGGGKTTLAGQFAMDAAGDGHNTLFVSLEMPAEDLLDRMIAYVARRPGLAVTDPEKYAREVLDANGPTKDMLQAIGGAARKIAGLPFHIEDMVGANVYRIAACIRRAHRIAPLKVAVVDFVQRIRPVPEKVRESKEQQISHASNHLADLAKELGFCLLLPSQLNKEGAAKHAEAINEDADLHLQIIQDRSGPAPTFEHKGIAVVKDRHHGQDGVLLPIVLDGPMLRFIPKPFSS
jgi:replicative DNA helicase